MMIGGTMALAIEPIENPEDAYDDAVRQLLTMQSNNVVKILRKEGELLLLIKQEPRQAVKYYMSKSGMSARRFNEILQQLIAANLVTQETCPDDGRRKLLS